MPKLSIDQDVQVEQLTEWPRDVPRTDPEERRSDPFPRGGRRIKKGIVKRTIDDLEMEIRQLGVENAVLQLDVSSSQVRQRDGLPYQRADVEPPVVLSFEGPDGATQTYPCDTYDSWEGNFRAIVKTLQALRSVDRYGVGRGDEQYTGYKGLPSNVDDRVGPEEAATILLRTAPEARGYEELDHDIDRLLTSEKAAADALRKAKARAHPDKQGGTHAHFKRVKMAGDVLHQYHEKNDGEK